MIWSSLQDQNLYIHALGPYVVLGTSSPRALIRVFCQCQALNSERYDTLRGKCHGSFLYFTNLKSPKTANASLTQLPKAPPTIRPELHYGHSALCSLQIPQFPNKPLPLHGSPLAQNSPSRFQRSPPLLRLHLLLTSQLDSFR